MAEKSKKDGADSGNESKRLDIPAPLVPLLNGVKSFYSSAQYSDLVIVCKQSKWNVHKIILGAQSEYFQKQCGGKFKEAQESKIELKDDDPQVVDAMLHYLYNIDYGDYGNSQEHVAPIGLDVRMFAFADSYFIEPLKNLSARKFTARAQTNWDTPEFTEAIREVYHIVPEHEDTLKKIVIPLVKKHAGDFFDKSKGFEHFYAVLHDEAEFAAHVSEILAPIGATEAKSYKCPSKGEVFTVAVPAGLRFGCPLDCYTDEPESWWAKYLVKK